MNRKYLFLESQLASSQAQQLEMQDEADRASAVAQERLDEVKRQAAAELDSQKAQWDNQFSLVQSEKLQLESNIIQLNTQLEASAKDLKILQDLHKAEEEAKAAEFEADNIDARRSHAQLLHDIRITKRELERTKEILRTREAKIDEMKSQGQQATYVEMANNVLRESMAKRDAELRQSNEEIRKLKSQLLRSSSQSLDIKTAMIDIQKKDKLILDLQAQVIAHEEGRRDIELEIEELQAQLAEKLFDSAAGSNMFLKVKKENSLLKKEKLTLLSQVSALKTNQIKRQPSQVVRPDREEKC